LLFARCVRDRFGVASARTRKNKLKKTQKYFFNSKNLLKN